MSRDPLKVAQGELGNTESPAGSNRTKYGAWYGMDGNPWCMMFVQWCFAMAGRQLPHRTASCSDLLSWYRKYASERIVTAPKPRDIVIYNFGHTGILESAAADTVTVLEGNTSAGAAGSQDNGGGVFRRTRSRTLVQAFIRPFDNYEEDIMTGEEIYKELNNYLKKQPVPSWAKAELEEAVRLGITDGKEPMAMIPRYQAAIMAKRAREGK
ncbi:MAG: CHAP domain-containing protein [Oscillibacter sp.]|nr:CHAP domain-containing protein [Oscillibacter sp.]